MRPDGNWRTRLLVLLSVGVVLYVIGAYMRGTPTAGDVLQDAGTALAVAVVIGFLVDRLMHAHLVREFDRGISRLESGSDVLRGAATSRIKDLFARRGSPEDRDRWDKRVRLEFSNQIKHTESGEILIACVAAPQFFRRDTEIGSILCDDFTVDECTCRVRVLLLCPDSDAANIRAQLERTHPTKNDIRTAGTFLREIRKQVGDRLKFKCYGSPASVFMVVTDRSLLLEPYATAQIEQRRLPLGGRAPMLVFARESESYYLWKQHFEYLWEAGTDYESHHGLDAEEA